MKELSHSTVVVSCSDTGGAWLTSCPHQAAKEFVSEAHGTERRWSRALQGERVMRLELQENLEALIKQMHGLESEARKASHQPSPQASISSGSSQAREEREERNKRGRAEEEPDSAVEPASEESEEEEFYDATEASAEEVTKQL